MSAHRTVRVVADIVKVNGPLAGMTIKDGYSVTCPSSSASKFVTWINNRHQTQRVVTAWSGGGDYLIASAARKVTP